MCGGGAGRDGLKGMAVPETVSRWKIIAAKQTPDHRPAYELNNFSLVRSQREFLGQALREVIVLQLQGMPRTMISILTTRAAGQA